VSSVTGCIAHRMVVGRLTDTWSSSKLATDCIEKDVYCDGVILWLIVQKVMSVCLSVRDLFYPSSKNVLWPCLPYILVCHMYDTPSILLRHFYRRHSSLYKLRVGATGFLNPGTDRLCRNVAKKFVLLAA
jgi:hypothetical protein